MQKQLLKYKIVVTSLLFMLMLVRATAQQNRTDISTESVLTSKGDVERINTLAKLAFDYAYTKPDSAIKLAQEAYSLSQQLAYPAGEALALNRIAGAYVVLGEYAKALRLYRQAFAISEHIKDISGIHRSLNNIGNMYMEQEDWHEALRYLRQARNATFGKASLASQSIEMQNIGACYLNLHRPDSALWYEQRALELAQKAAVETEADILRIMGEAELEKQDYVSALRYFQQCVSYNLKYSDTLNLSRAYLALGDYYKKKGQKDSVLYYTHEALRLAQSGSYPKGMLEACKQLAAFYEGNDNRQALHYLKQAMLTNDSLFGWKRAKQLALVDYEEDLRQREIETDKKDLRNKIILYATLAGAGVLLILAVILYRNNRQKHRANALLQLQKEKVQSALTELKVTQAQLVQREKMASLGELTAGIAHEIQNPLNFITNFSDVNKELLTELVEEAEKGNLAEVNAIAKDIGENEQKIVQHGKRAESIVKGMLQHSRSIAWEKEPTDINKLADEYLRLSYQTQRAKDKSFSAALHTHFDSSIGKIDVVPQDLGRVLLNLFNNAFYSVQQKRKQLNGIFEPAVSVSTKKEKGKIEIAVRDNGVGISQKIMEKIFQPFFTTKPSGEGTGLGLSLSHDIITKGHSGEIKVESKEEEGAVFVVQLPV